MHTHTHTHTHTYNLMAVFPFFSSVGQPANVEDSSSSSSSSSSSTAADSSCSLPEPDKSENTSEVAEVNEVID